MQLMHYALVILLMHEHESVQGDYILRAHVSAYRNPDNVCFRNRGRRCCDDDSRICSRTSENCDNEFFFCVRALGAPVNKTPATSGSVTHRAGGLQCLNPSSAIISNINRDGSHIDFSDDTFLGVRNPMEFQVTASLWEGIQFHVNVVDFDGETKDPNDLVDVFYVNINPRNLVAGNRMESTLDGIYDIARIKIIFQLECQDGFSGDLCEGISTTIHDGMRTENISSKNESCCVNGRCLEKGGTFICQCNPGNTGEFCNATSNESETVRNVTGGMVGSLSLIILAVLVVTTIIFGLIWVKQRLSKENTQNQVTAPTPKESRPSVDGNYGSEHDSHTYVLYKHAGDPHSPVLEKDPELQENPPRISVVYANPEALPHKTSTTAVPSFDDDSRKSVLFNNPLYGSSIQDNHYAGSHTSVLSDNPIYGSPIPSWESVIEL